VRLYSQDVAQSERRCRDDRLGDRLCRGAPRHVPAQEKDDFLDFAYYLIFGAYVLLTLTFQQQPSWAATVNAAQFRTETVKVADAF
jgi:hypothetical protein